MSKKAIAFSLLASVIIVIAASQFVYSASESQKPLRYVPSYPTPVMDVAIGSNLLIYPLAVGLCYDRPIFVSCPIDETGFTITLQNYGLEDINFEMLAQVDSSNSITNGDNTTIEVDIISGVVPGDGGDVRPEVSITTSGEISNTTVYAHISITHDASGYPDSPFIIPICITIANCDYWDDTYDLSTACKSLRLVNNGVMSNSTENASMDYHDPIDPDDCANIYLYEGSPIICREIDGEKRCFFTVYEGEYESDHALRPMSAIAVDSLSNPSYTKAQYELITADSAIGLRCEYYAPKHPDSCEFIIHRVFWWNRTEETLMDVGVGEFLDWDIPGYGTQSIANESGFYLYSNFITYQYACGKDPCDTLTDSYRYGGVAPYPSWSLKNYMTLENDVFVWSSGPFGSEAPLPADTIYGLMTGVFGSYIASIDSCEDLSTMITFDVKSLYPTDTGCATLILATSRDDADGNLLKSYGRMANHFMLDHQELHYCPTFDIIPGDANDDGMVNVGDAVYLISYIFFGSIAPQPYTLCSGDANGDCECNVGDPVTIIRYVFGGGPPPVDLYQWLDNCGWPLR